MKLRKSKKIPAKMVKVLFDTYLWGYNIRCNNNYGCDFLEKKIIIVLLLLILIPFLVSADTITNYAVKNPRTYVYKHIILKYTTMKNYNCKNCGIEIHHKEYCSLKCRTQQRLKK